MYGTLYYDKKLFFIVDKVAAKDGKVFITGSTYDHVLIPEDEYVNWIWRGTDNVVIYRGRSTNMFRGLEIKPGDRITMTQPIILRENHW